MPGPNASTQKTRMSTRLKRLLLIAVFSLTAVSIFVMQSANLPDRNAATTNATVSPTETPTPDTLSAASLPDSLGSDASPLASAIAPPPTPQLLTDPFLQLPTASSVQVVWFTEFEGTEHTVEYGENLTVTATTTQLSRTREDSDSQVQGRAYPALTKRDIWRHEATVTELIPGNRTNYRVISTTADGQTATSDFFSLSATPAPGQPLQILLTSDHQLKPLTPANLQKVEETIGRVDAVFFAGDLINIPDRASEWFDNAEGLAFFPGLQGRANHPLTKGDTTTVYKGGQLIQHAPLFPAIGNHEVMGRYADDKSLKAQYSGTLPRQVASELFPKPDDADIDADR